MRLVGFIISTPVAGFIVFGYQFYALWLKNYSPVELQIVQTVSVITTIPYLFSCVAFPLIQINTACNKVRTPVLVALAAGIANILVVFPLGKADALTLNALACSTTPIYHARKVAVVGGGNVAMDAARSAIRLGAEEVYVLYRRSFEEIPARQEEVQHAQEEQIRFQTLTNPVEILGSDDGNVTGVRCIRMELGEPDATGRRRPVPVPDSDFVIDADCVIIAIGTSPNPLIKSTTGGLEVNARGGIVADENGRTSRDGVFAGGDTVTGAATVIKAMGAGKIAAKSIDAYIQNK